MCSTAVPAVDSLFCLWVVIFHEDNQTLGGHLFLNVYTNQLPAHPFVHPSTVSLLRVARDPEINALGWTLFSSGQYL